MQFEKSCGFVVYRDTDHGRRYLIIRSSRGECGFPKGHTEPGETELETAMRELKEETNLEAAPVEGFRREISYRLRSNMNITKRVVYFLGKAKDGPLLCQESELLGAEFLPLEQALARLPFDSIIEILKEADSFLSAPSCGAF